MTTKVDTVVWELRYRELVRVGFDYPTETTEMSVCVTTTRPDQARWLISQASRNIAAEDAFFLAGAGLTVVHRGVATHRRQGYVLGHWRSTEIQRCGCDLK